MIPRLLFVALLGLLASLVVKNLHIGIDFYHFWVVGAARERSEKALGSPYAEAVDYAAVVNADADRIWLRYLTRAEIRTLEANSEQVSRVLERLVATYGEAGLADVRQNSRFLTINMRRRALDLTGTPLLYALCTWLPSRYEDAYELWAWMGFAAFMIASVLLLRATGRPWAELMFWAVCLALVMRPLNTDVRVGNMNALHLLVAALALWAACGPLARASEDRQRVRWGAFVLSMMALYLLLKPTFAFAVAALVAHVAITLRRALFVRAAIPAAVVTLVLVAVPCVVFGAPGVWFDWLGYIGQDAEKLAYGIEKSNLSTPLHLTTWFPALSLVAWSAVLGVLFLASFAAVVATGPGQGFAAKLRHALARIARDPLAAASMGLCVTLATSPLVWGHYLTVSAIPIVWYALWEPRMSGRPAKAIRGALFLTTALLYLGIVDLVLTIFAVVDSDGTVRSITAFAWIPLWILLLDWLRVRLSQGEEPLAEDAAALPTSSAFAR